MLIQSPAILDVELGKIALVGINTFHDIDLDNFSITDLILDIYKNLSKSKKAKEALKQLSFVDYTSSPVVPLFTSSFDLKEKKFYIELRLGFLNLSGRHFQKKTIFIHDITTNKTTIDDSEKLFINQSLVNAPHKVHVRSVNDFIIQELDISTSDIRYFLSNNSLHESIGVDWFGDLINNNNSDNIRKRPTMILEVDVSKAISVFGIENYISVMIRKQFVFEGISMSEKQKRLMTSFLRTIMQHMTITFDPKKVVDGKIAIFISLPIDTFNRARRQRFALTRHAASNRSKNRHEFDESYIHSRYGARQASLVYELLKIKKLTNFSNSILG